MGRISVVTWLRVFQVIGWIYTVSFFGVVAIKLYDHAMSGPLFWSMVYHWSLIGWIAPHVSYDFQIGIIIGFFVAGLIYSTAFYIAVIHWNKPSGSYQMERVAQMAKEYQRISGMSPWKRDANAESVTSFVDRR